MPILMLKVTVTMSTHPQGLSPSKSQTVDSQACKPRTSLLPLISVVVSPDDTKNWSTLADSFLPLFIILSCETGILTPYPLSSTNTDKTQSTHRPDNVLLKFSLKALNMCCQFLQRQNKCCSVNPLRCKISTHCRLAVSVVFFLRWLHLSVVKWAWRWGWM